MKMWSPWGALGRLPHLTVVWLTMPGRLGLTDGATIWLHPRQSQVERRCTLAHELVHIERGIPAGCDTREELAVAKEAARRLIPVRAMGEALAWSRDENVVADELFVDVDTLRTRVAHLHPSERHYLKRRLAHLLEGAVDE